MGGHKQFNTSITFTSLNPEVNVVETCPFTLTTFTGMH